MFFVEAFVAAAFAVAAMPFLMEASAAFVVVLAPLVATSACLVATFAALLALAPVVEAPAVAVEFAVSAMTFLVEALAPAFVAALAPLVAFAAVLVWVLLVAGFSGLVLLEAELDVVVQAPLAVERWAQADHVWRSRNPRLRHRKEPNAPFDCTVKCRSRSHPKRPVHQATCLHPQRPCRYRPCGSSVSPEWFYVQYPLGTATHSIDR